MATQPVEYTSPPTSNHGVCVVWSLTNRHARSCACAHSALTRTTTKTASVFICSFMMLGKDDVWKTFVSLQQDLYMCMYLVLLTLLIHLAARGSWRLTNGCHVST